MKHEKIIWEPGARGWICAQCGRTSNETNVHAAHEQLDRYDCRLNSTEASKTEPGTETSRFIKKSFGTLSLSPTERSGSRFAVRTVEGKAVIQLELFHGTASGLKAVSIAFELLGGTTWDQAKELVDAMNERIVGVIVTPRV